ncbi:MAG: hypothetical protein AAGK14_04495 [Verrucomicrobiota bacterium]
MGIFALMGLLTGCGGGGNEGTTDAGSESEAKTEASAPAEGEATAAADPEKATAFLDEAQKELEAANELYQSAQQEFVQELSKLAPAESAEGEEGAAPDVTSEENQEALAKAEEKLAGVNEKLEKHAQAALVAYQKAAEADPTMVDAYLGQFQMQYMLGDQQAAFEAMNKATEVLAAKVRESKPTEEDLFNLIRLYASQGKIDDAEAMLKDIKAKYPDDEKLQEIADQTLQEIDMFRQQPPPGMPSPPQPGAPGAPAAEGGEAPAASDDAQ